MADHHPPFTGSSNTDVSPARPRSPLRWIVPLALFFVIIGGIAWLAQNMATWRTPSRSTGPNIPKGPEMLLGFWHPFDPSPREQAFFSLWEDFPKKGDKDQTNRLYAREYERGAKGRYYFPFKVHPEQGSEFGVSYKSCDCAELDLAVVPADEGDQFGKSMIEHPSAEPVENPAWTWRSLKKTEQHGIQLEANSRAILRVEFSNRRPPGDSLNLRNRLWARPASGQQQVYDVKINAVSASALRTKRDRVDVGIIQPGGLSKANFLVWSPTRDEVKFALQEKNNDQLFKVDVTPRDRAACAELQAQLRQEGILTRVRAAWDVSVTVYESKDGRQFDQGYFLRSLGYELTDSAEDLPPLVVTGLVRSDDIQIGGVADQGKIDLKSFLGKEGTKRAMFVATNRDIELDSQNITVQPAAVRVKLIEKTKDKAAAKRNWSLEVEVPPNQFFGTIPEDCAVILRTKATPAKATPPRSIRIPLVGHATQS